MVPRTTPSLRSDECEEGPKERRATPYRTPTPERTLDSDPTYVQGYARGYADGQRDFGQFNILDRILRQDIIDRIAQTAAGSSGSSQDHDIISNGSTRGGSGATAPKKPVPPGIKPCPPVGSNHWGSNADEFRTGRVGAATLTTLV